MTTPSAPEIEQTHRYTTQKWLPTWIRYTHETRYAWAAESVVGLKVLDAACGSGYGSAALLKGGASRVDGVDLAKDGIDEAGRLHCADRLFFHQGNVLAFEFPNESFDAIVSFETIEHVHDDRAYLREMLRVLRPGGTFLCSTPNRSVTNPGTSLVNQPYNPYHVREYTSEELYALLFEYFSSVEPWGQAWWPDSYIQVLKSVSKVYPALAVKVHQAVKVLHMPIDRASTYAPKRPIPGRTPEALVFRCRRA